MPAAALSIRIDLPNGSRLGPGKVALLEAVHRHRSISAAARDLDMSYRRAWLLIDDVNRAFSVTIIETFPGRSQGAGAALTPSGERLVAVYRAAEERCRKAAHAALIEISQSSDPQYQPNGITRSPKKDAAGA
jgi:molybdate transport system regulatory protein